jgi:DNA invertase Pin-like site-specific DNA recombinase
MNKKIERVVLYARVSKDNTHQDPKVQLRDLRQYCQLRGWEVVREYVDKGISGAKAQRPELDKLMAAVASGEFDAVVIWKFDRFARSVIHLLEALKTFKANEVSFVSITENIDTSTEYGKFILTILGAVADLERGLITERIHAGLRNARAEGHKLGRPFGPSAKARKLDVASLKRRHSTGETLRHIADDLGVSHSYVWKLLQLMETVADVEKGR